MQNALAGVMPPLVDKTGDKNHKISDATMTSLLFLASQSVSLQFPNFIIFSHFLN